MFEFVTVMALKYFAEQKCDLVIWETGLGGRLDATNIVTPLASVITNIAFDHQQWLGDTLAKIAAEKAGIIKPGVPVITATDEPEALAVIEEIAREQKGAAHNRGGGWQSAADQICGALPRRRYLAVAGRTPKNQRRAGAGHGRGFAKPNSSRRRNKSAPDWPTSTGRDGCNWSTAQPAKKFCSTARTMWPAQKLCARHWKKISRRQDAR